MIDYMEACEELNEYLNELNIKSIMNVPKINYLNVPVTLVKPTEDNAILFNKILRLCRESDLKQTIRTKSGGIAVANYWQGSGYSYTFKKTGAEILFTGHQCFRLQFRAGIYDDGESKMSGRKAFQLFCKLCEEYDIDLESHAVSKEEGLAIKETIEKPLIKIEENIEPFVGKDMSFVDCHHIDIHNSYPAGLAESHEEFAPLINMLYERRKNDEKYKAVLNFTIGFMQSEWCQYRYAALSRDAIHINNDKIKSLANKLKESGRRVLLYNTDGIWYTGDIYHDENEGPKLGQWHNDHVNCKLRIKSAGAYEYIEDDKYHPVMRGYTNLDTVKPRDEWHWGDIFSTDVLTFRITEQGILNNKGEIIYG